MSAQIFENHMNRVIIVAETVDMRVLYALRHVKSISGDITVFCASANAAEESALLKDWDRLGTGVPLVFCYSPDGSIIDPLLGFIRSNETGRRLGESITIILPWMVAAKWWQRLLHNHTIRFIARRLSAEKRIAVTVLPIHLTDDREVLASGDDDYQCGRRLNL